jgi:drug/metabolite transporter (DMT)-like permease
VKSNSAGPVWFGVLIGAVGAFFFSGKAIIIKLAYREGADAISLIALRMLYALPCFVLMAWWVEYKRRTRGEPTVWRQGDAWKIILLGLTGYYLASFLDFLGLQYVSAALERIILYLTPSLVLLIAVLFYRRPVGRVEVVSLLVAYSGVVFVFWHDLSLKQHNVWLGSCLVLASAICYAVYLSRSGEMVQRLGSLRLTAAASLVSCAACILQALILGPQALFTQTAAVHGLSIINGVFCTVLPITLTMMAIERVGSPIAAQTGMIGPVATIFLGAWYLGEPITAPQLAGTAVVLAGMFYLSKKKA